MLNISSYYLNPEFFLSSEFIHYKKRCRQYFQNIFVKQPVDKLLLQAVVINKVVINI